MPGSIHVLRTEFSRSVKALRTFAKEKGLVNAVGEVAAVAGGQLAFPITRARRLDRRFVFRGTHLPYTFARYNTSYRNERTVEISIAKWFLSADVGRTLEVGNVMSHYGVRGHTVLDKYEIIPGVLNDDIIEFIPDQLFDTVISISTLEHVGWDEKPREPGKVFRAFDAARNCVAPEGRMLVTVPIGYNKTLDGALRTGEVEFPQESWLVRTSRSNEWIETDRDEALGKKYGQPYRNANAIYAGMITR
ncbi:MAG: SAM-dependent methyltransferase [Pseudonocardiaceae bacterium]